MLRDVPSAYGAEARDEVFMNAAPGISVEELPPPTAFDPLDDVFGSAPSSPVLTGRDESAPGERVLRPPPPADPSDIPRLRNTHVNNGYREGIAASKEKYLQEGFDEGYVLGAELGLRAGWCLGQLEGMLHALPSEDSRSFSTDLTLDPEASSQSRPVTPRQLEEALRRATEELDLRNLFAEKYFGADGKWLYEVQVERAGTESGPSAAHTAAAHPVIIKWNGIVTDFSEQLGMTLS